MAANAGVSARPVDWVAIVMGISFALMWSSAFTSAKIAVTDAPPFVLLTFRFFLSGLMAMGIAAAMGQKLPSSRRIWLMILIIGVCQNSLYLGLNFLAMTEVPAGLAAIIASSLPLTVALAGAVFLKARLVRLAVLGLAIGFGGVLLIMAGRIEGGVSIMGLVCCVIGVIALTVATLVVKGADLGRDLLMIVGLQMLAGSVTLLPVALLFESTSDINWTWRLAAAFAYTTIVPGVIATIIWFRLVRRIGATHAATYHFLNPAFGVVVASLLLGEQLDMVDWTGVVMITASILLVQLSGRKPLTNAAAFASTKEISR